MRKFLTILFIVQLLALNALVFYYGGVRKYGTPAEFQAKRALLAKARQDSIRLAEMETVAPGNAGDSTLYELGNHTRLFERTAQYENEIRTLQAALDSLKREKAVMEKLQATLSQKENQMKSLEEQAQSKDMIEMAKMFEAMKPQQAIPVMKQINDTLVVGILSRMQSRNSAKLLGALAQSDTLKAVRVSKLLARKGTLLTK
jgi:flagellar motility protein MotE (MotC chaperone)